MQKLLLSSLISLSGSVYAMSFSHLDWEIACDNTHTCRMAGYQLDGNPAVSILMTYPAGAKAKLSGKIQVEQSLQQANLWINAQNQGVIQFKQGKGQLTSSQLNKILATAKQNNRIELRFGEKTWHVSDRGLTAVLLKADEYQKRVGTTSALIAKGQNSAYQVRQALSMPSYRIVNYQPAKAQHYALNSVQAKTLLPLFKKTTRADDCPNLWHGNDLAGSQISIYPINAQQVLVARPCWHGAYNFGVGMWLMSKDLQKVQQFVTPSASSFSEGKIFASHKGRGIGDCNTQDEWVFTGQRFIPSYSAVNLQCKGFVGGAWNLTTLLSKVTR